MLITLSHCHYFINILHIFHVNTFIIFKHYAIFYETMLYMVLKSTPPAHESGSPWTKPTDMHSHGIPQSQRRMPMHPLRRTVQHLSHYKVHKDVDTIPLCRWYKLSMIYNLYCTQCVKSSTKSAYSLTTIYHKNIASSKYRPNITLWCLCFMVVLLIVFE